MFAVQVQCGINGFLSFSQDNPDLLTASNPFQYQFQYSNKALQLNGYSVGVAQTNLFVPSNPNFISYLNQQSFYSNNVFVPACGFNNYINKNKASNRLNF